MITKVLFILRLIRTTPRYPLIVFTQLVSGAASIAGLPLLVPILNYMEERPLAEAGTQDHLGPVTAVLGFFNVEPSFRSLLIVAAGLIIAGQCLIFISSLLANNAQTDALAEYRRKIFTAYSKADWLWLCENRSGEMNYTVLREAELASVAHLNAQRVLIYTVQVCALLFVTIRLSWPITLLALLVYGFVAWLSTYNSSRVQKLSYKFNEQYKAMSNEFAGMQQNKKFLKTSLLSEKSLGRIFRQVDSITENVKTQNVRIEMQNTLTASTTLIFLMGLMFFHQQLSLNYSELFLILFVFLRLAPQFSALSTAYVSLDGNIPMYRSMHERLKSLLLHQEGNGTRDFHSNSIIRFDNVEFSYPNGKKVLSGLTLTIEPQQTTAIMGSSGAGKSTVLDLILGLLSPQKGKIFYGTISQDEINKDSLRSKVAYVGQETTLVDGTIKDNLLIGGLNVSESKVWDVLRKAGLESTVKSMSQELDTPVGENGIKLSGGQRQRLALARALFMDPEILILDEATSSLDEETEALIQETIKILQRELTIIIVTHRISSVRIAHKFYALLEGKIYRSGKPEEHFDFGDTRKKVSTT